MVPPVCCEDAEEEEGARRSGDLGLAFLVRRALARGTWPHQGRLLAAAFSTDSLRTQFEAPFPASLDPCVGLPCKILCLVFLVNGACRLPPVTVPFQLDLQVCHIVFAMQCSPKSVLADLGVCRCAGSEGHGVLVAQGAFSVGPTWAAPKQALSQLGAVDYLGKWHFAGSPVKLRVAVYRENVIAIT